MPDASPKLHSTLAGQEKINVVVRKQDCFQGAEVFRLVLLHPEIFGAVYPGSMALPASLMSPSGTTEFCVELFALLHGGGVAPEFCRPNDAVLFVERDKPVLLPADADGFDIILCLAEMPQALPDRAVDSVEPYLRILFQMPRREPRRSAHKRRTLSQGLRRIQGRARWSWCFGFRYRCQERSWILDFGFWI
jgi:hypothetical protein